jgi:hypothetical protein
MPRRIPDYAQQFADFNVISGIGAFGFGFSQLLVLVVVFQALKRRRQGFKPALGRCTRAGMDGALTGALSYLRGSAGVQSGRGARMTRDPSREQNSRRIAIGLALFAAAVFLSFVIRQWLSNT